MSRSKPHERAGLKGSRGGHIQNLAPLAFRHLLREQLSQDHQRYQ